MLSIPKSPSMPIVKVSVDLLKWRTPISLLSAVATTALLASRAPDRLLNPQLWAEDGPVFLEQAQLFGISALSHPYAGYLNLIPRIIAYVSDRLVAIDNIPTSYMIGAFLVVFSTALFIASSRLQWPTGPGFALALILIPQSGEVFLTITNLQWMTASTFVVLALQERPKGIGRTVVDFVALLLIGLTGPFVIFFFPLLATRLLRSPTTYDIALVAVATGLAAIQAVFVLTDGAPLGVQGATIVESSKIFAHLIQQLVTGWLGDQAGITEIVTIAILIGLGGLIVKAAPHDRITLLLLLAGAASILAGAVAKLGGSAVVKYDLSGYGARYVYVPGVLMAWTFVTGAVVARSRTTTIFSIAVLASIGLTTASRFVVAPLPDLNWRAHTAVVGSKSVAIPTNPSGWSTNVHR